MKKISRRSFCKAVSTAAASALLSPAAFAIDPLSRTTEGRLRLSLSAYSLRSFFNKQGEDKMTLMDFIKWSSKQDLDAVEPTAYFFPDEPSREFLTKLKRRCFLEGLDVSGGAIGNNFTHPPESPEAREQLEHVTTWIRHYAVLGAPVIRVFAGQPPEGMSEEQAIENSVTNLEKACRTAGKHGIHLGLENHDFLMNVDRMMNIVEAVDSPWFGVNFDSANITGGKPYQAMEKLAPYAVNAQIKTIVRGPNGEEEADFNRIIRILRDGGYSGYVALEYERSENPLKSIPRYLKRLRKAIDQSQK